MFDDGVISIEDSTEANINNAMNKSQLKIDLKGNTSQESTTGKNLLQPTARTTASNGITTAVNSDGSVTISGTPSSNWFFIGSQAGVSIPAGTYTFSIQNTLPGSIRLDLTYSDSTTENLFTIVSGNTSRTFTTSKTIAKIVIEVMNNATSFTLPMTLKLMLESGSTATSYEPYTNGPAPSPDYPYPVNVVTRDNTINVVGKNLFNIEDLLVNAQDVVKSGDSYTFKTQAPMFNTTIPFKYISNERITISYKITNGTGTNFRIRYVYEDGYLADGSGSQTGTEEKSITTSSAGLNEHGRVIGLRANWSNIGTFTIKDFMVNSGTTASAYEPYQSQTYPINLGSIELCKIGDYQDVIKRSSGKNLVNSVETHHGINGTTGAITTENAYLGIEDYVSCEPNTTYTISFQHDIPTAQLYVGYKDKSGTYLERVFIGTTRTFTTPNNAYYMFAYVYYSNSFSTIGGYVMLNEGSTALPYEPYGKVWYKYGAIGKVILSSVSTWVRNTVGDFYVVGFSSAYGYISGQGLSNIFNYSTTAWIKNCFGITSSGVLWISTKDETLTLPSEFITYLTNKNAIMYGVLSTPTITEITDTTLIEQLDGLEKAYSYGTQTNISQTNQDKPFILDINAIADNVNGLKLENENQEYKTNKVIELSSNSTDDEYPSAKCVYDIVGNIEAVLAAMDSGSGV